MHNTFTTLFLFIIFILNDISKEYNMHLHGYFHEFRHKRAATANRKKLWKNAIIPYVFAKEISPKIKMVMKLAMNEWQSSTCIRFERKQSHHKDFVLVTNMGVCGCCSLVGRVGGKQTITMNDYCSVYGVALHELGHVIGFWHEHSRPDRDRHIRILKENIILNKLENFDKKSIDEIDSLGENYDFQSIMHYRLTTFSKNGKNTIRFVNKTVYLLGKVGQRDKLSAGDIRQTNLLYNCDCRKKIINIDFHNAKNNLINNITSPNYPNNYFKNYNCSWIFRINRPDKLELEIKIYDIETEKSRNCSYDFLEIIQANKQLIKVCGEGKGGVLKTNAYETILRFVSDKTVTARGFLVKYRYRYSKNVYANETFLRMRRPKNYFYYFTDCGQRAFKKQLNGSITNPIIPLFLGKNTSLQSIRCNWLIEMNKFKYFKKIIFFIENSLNGSHKNCFGDLFFYENNNLKEKRRKLEYNCSKNKPLIINRYKQLQIKWRADRHSPFKLNFSIVLDNCKLLLGYKNCSQICQTTITSYKCSCKPGYHLHLNGKDCDEKRQFIQKTCQSILNAERGSIIIDENVNNCSIHILTGRLNRIIMKMQISGWLLANDSEYSICESGNLLHIRFDSVIKNILKRNQLKKICIVNNHRAKYFRFKTLSGFIHINSQFNRSQVLKFNASYLSFRNKYFRRLNALVGKKQELNVTRSLYKSSSRYVWLISAKFGSIIKMRFSYILLEDTQDCHFDFVSLIEKRKNLTGRFCGFGFNNLNKVIFKSKNNKVWLIFQTDSSGREKGFHFEYWI